MRVSRVVLVGAAILGLAAPAASCGAALAHGGVAHGGVAHDAVAQDAVAQAFSGRVVAPGAPLGWRVTAGPGFVGDVRVASAQAGAEFEDAAARGSASASEVLVHGVPEVAAALRERGLRVEQVASDADRARAYSLRVAADRGAPLSATTSGDEFPVGFEEYHTYDETLASLNKTAADFPQMAKLVDFGTSEEGRRLQGIKISDNVGVDEREPEVLINCNTHAREHLTAEQCLHLIHRLTSGYASDARLKKIVDGRELIFLPMNNPDGAMYDLYGRDFQTYRKTRKVVDGKPYGIDPNRNYSFKWAQGPGGSSDKPWSDVYRGTKPFETAETIAIEKFAASRVVGGAQQIQGFLDVHTFSEQVLFPWAWTKQSTNEAMTADEYGLLSSLAKDLASTNGFDPLQSSKTYISDGESGDYFFGHLRIPAFTFELSPKGNTPAEQGFYPPGKDIPALVKKNEEAFWRFFERADCYWSFVGKPEKCLAGRWPDAR